MLIGYLFKDLIRYEFGNFLWFLVFLFSWKSILVMYNNLLFLIFVSVSVNKFKFIVMFLFGELVKIFIINWCVLLFDLFEEIRRCKIFLCFENL